MHVWLITIGEPLPIDSDNVRLYRTGILANLMIEKGHCVVWWSSSFDHMNKIHRFKSNKSIDYRDSFTIKLLHSISYDKNISLRRIINHHRIANSFRKLSKDEQTPDIILCSFPSIELAEKAIKYGKLKKVPVVIDARDMWPDIFLKIPPASVRWMLHLFLFPIFNKVKKIFSNAAAIFGITPSFVKWGLNYAQREISKYDMDFPFGYCPEDTNSSEKKNAIKFWKDMGVTKESNEFIICFFGAIGHQFEFETVIEASKILNNRNFKFVICGAGDNLEYYKKLGKRLNNIIFPGWIGKSEIHALMNISSVGLAPYYSTEDFMVSLPNKTIEYLSAGLPIVSSLKGILKDLLKKNDCGLTYENNDAYSLVENLIYLYNNPDILQQKSQNALKLFEEKFVAKKVYGNMISHLEMIAEEYKRD